MNQSDSDSAIPLATLVESPRRKMPVGCMAAIIVAGLSGCLTLVAIAWFMWLAFSDLASRRQAAITAWRDLRVEVSQDIDWARTAAWQPASGRDHPEYDRIVAFIDSMQSVLDDTANPELHKLVDFDLCMDALIQRANSLDHDPLRLNALRANLEKTLAGPTPFSFYEIKHIENDGPSRYRVYLVYSAGYRASEPHLWWLADNGGLRIYDWSQPELGPRDSTETAILFDASDLQSQGYSKFAKLCHQYLATAEEELSHFERKERVKQILAECEQFRGPLELRSSMNLITARRWQHEGESERALTLLEKIADPNIVPGVYSLTGDIQYDRGDFQEAVKAYQKYVELLGPAPYVQSRLADCFREMGDADSEREALLVLTRSISERNLAAVAHLVELNDESQNWELFGRIDKLPCRDAAYLHLLRTFGWSAYFSDRLEQLHEHLQKTAPQSGPAMLASAKSNPQIENLVAILKRIDEVGEVGAEDSMEMRANLWHELDETRFVELLESSPKLEENFAAICEVSDYDEDVSDETMLAASELVLRSHPDNFKAHYQKGIIQNRQQQYKLAIDSLRKALEAMPDSHDDASYVRLVLLSALYRSGDFAAALELAAEPELAAELLDAKSRNDDFADFDVLLKRLDADANEFKFYSALLRRDQGDAEAALRALADLVAATENDGRYDYRLYRYRGELVDLCEQQNDIAKAFALEPSDAMFELVRRRLIQNFDWPNLERLFRTEAVAARRLQSVQLRQEIDWEQGRYERVVDLAPVVLELAKTEDVSVELERLVRSALRIGELEQAMSFARQAAFLADRQDLVTLVALRSRIALLSVWQLQRLSQHQKEQLHTDPDLLHSAWRDVVHPGLLPPRHRPYFLAGQQQFDLRMLFSQSQEFREEQLQAGFAAALGEDVRVERVEQPGESGTTWVVRSPHSRILISQESMDGALASKSCDIESLKEAIGASSSQLRVVGLANAPTTAQADYDLSVAAIKCLANDGLRAVGNFASWLTAADFARFMDQESEQRESASSRLFGGGEFEGEYFFLNQGDGSQAEVGDQDFLKELVAALKQFEKSADAQKTLVVQVSPREGIPERIEAMVDRIRRTGYGSVTLATTIQRDAGFDQSIRKGDQVMLSLHEVDGFELRTSGQVLQRDRNPN